MGVPCILAIFLARLAASGIARFTDSKKSLVLWGYACFLHGPSWISIGLFFRIIVNHP